TLIRGELSAIRSIDSAMDKISDEAEKNELMGFRSDHVRACETLRRFSSSDIRDESQKSGPWSSFTKAFVGGASLFGDKAAVKALRVGEEHGINEYREALESGDINDNLKDIIRRELLPQQERHLEKIDRYLH